ncbi:4-oxalocrotonate tautomerase [Pseudomonas sp. SZ57]|nr:4-oxalocrotonate tautomerase [Pseudomonas syringae pv. syringae]MCF5179828.1 4-oxalocrotonate tautomerase [Pseudomonas syringae]MQQ33214.1 4-oxalocrotonate tautomerase [Pseudomonas sp. SZ57]MCF5316090.1 4-oxalocrotonate tautomerase [Pseudomonas syringae]MCF5361814.1 4-oxalocrotonate tautomerase [Pseudomonas syringae]
MAVCLWLITSDRVFNPKQEYIMPVVRVSWFEGKEHAQKAAVAAEITESIVKNTGTPAEYIYVIFEDVAPSDWAGAGKLFGETPATP